MWASKQAGMTLPEILIVLALMAGSLSIVAPLSVEMVEKRKAKLELVELKERMLFLQYQANLSNRKIIIELEKKNFRAFTKNLKPLVVTSFDELNVIKKRIEISSTGLANGCSINVILNGEVVEFKMFERLCTQ